MLAKDDARTLSPKALDEKRKTAMRLLEQGQSFNSVAELCGVHPRTVREWKRLYLEHGLTGIISKTRGRKKGEHRTLTREQEEMLSEVLRTKTPSDYGLKECLWNRACIQFVIEKEFSIIMPHRTISHYMHRMGFTLQVAKKKPMNEMM